MLLDNDLDTYEIQDFCVETLESDAAYRQFCIDTVDDYLTYDTDTRIDDLASLPAYPFCIAFAGDEDQDLLEQEWGHKYEIALIFGIKDKRTELIENNIRKFTDTRSVEKIAKEAIKVIRTKMKKVGIKDDYEISLLSGNGSKTPTGEADDINYILSLTFGYLDDINKGC